MVMMRAIITITIIPMTPSIPQMVHVLCCTVTISPNFCLVTPKSTALYGFSFILLAFLWNSSVLTVMTSDSFRVIGSILGSAANSRNSSARHSCLRVDTEQSIFAGRVIFASPSTGYVVGCRRVPFSSLQLHQLFVCDRRKLSHGY